MDKAIEILSDWQHENEKYLENLIHRRDWEKKWADKDSHKEYYTPIYFQTKAEVEKLENEIAEVEKALTALFELTEVNNEHKDDHSRISGISEESQA